jgi:hypothetical protein
MVNMYLDHIFYQLILTFSIRNILYFCFEGFHLNGELFSDEHIEKYEMVHLKQLIQGRWRRSLDTLSTVYKVLFLCIGSFTLGSYESLICVEFLMVFFFPIVYRMLITKKPSSLLTALAGASFYNYLVIGNLNLSRIILNNPQFIGIPSNNVNVISFGYCCCRILLPEGSRASYYSSDGILFSRPFQVCVY